MMTFSSDYRSRLMKTYKCQIKRSQPRHPQSNGREERLNGTIHDTLYATDQSITSFDQALQLTQDKYN